MDFRWRYKIAMWRRGWCRPLQCRSLPWIVRRYLGALLHTPEKIHNKEKLEEALIGYDLGYSDEKAGAAIEMILHLWPNIRSTRMMGSAALGLAYAACGRTDLYFHHHLSQWDLAAALVIVSEAKGVTADRQGEPASLSSKSIIAANPSLLGAFFDKTRGTAWRANR